MNTLRVEADKVVWSYGGQNLVVEPWGEDSFRVRATLLPELDRRDWALLPPKPATVHITRTPESITVANGKIRAVVNRRGQIRFFNQNGLLLLEECWRMRTTAGEAEDAAGSWFSPLNVPAREFTPLTGGKYQLTVRFEAQPDEKIYGMGQYQQPYLNLKGCTLELAQRNSQASVPFIVSNRGYGLLWNNPAVGEASFARNETRWSARVTGVMDYWITAGDTPTDISRNYGEATGTAPMLPAFATGFWQCKLRYRTQDELLKVAREHKRRGLPLAVIVIDYFHWPNQGDWCFDKRDWPDPAAMVQELKSLGIELMVSVWPTVEHRSANYAPMLAKGYLVQTDRGLPVTMGFLGNTTFFDTTNDKAGDYVWAQAKQNYYDIGIRTFWLDVAEPEYTAYHFDNYRYQLGPVLEVGNIYPLKYAEGFYRGLRAAGETEIVNLLRCAWAGSQRFGALVWSGDIPSTFQALRNQIAAGLNMGVAGIPWWTTDIGGFDGGNIHDPLFQELLIRWFQWAVFCPVMRLHGYRRPIEPPLEAYRDGIAQCDTGAANEIWSYGEENYALMARGLALRERLRPYVLRQMRTAHETGLPVMRPLFYDFPAQPEAWDVEDQYMFGPDILVAPITEAGQRSRRVWLPAGTDWIELESKTSHPGGAWGECDAPIEAIPVFVRTGAAVLGELEEGA
ncbi:glycoside hydrolase family 31 protein [Telmatospirillum sp.]|uniref:glycoside hydrolase family 31 protein n=1 Tax=Telmatospirillum sp. TaxID=2079197 RepID=UPI00284EC58D|nr:glycoside hydrolase family 31 protein [Telmatospirillum sp.]MDR3441200.1 glycoside hydrolase family 31 protein [Telmatospirillum sp.]